MKNYIKYINPNGEGYLYKDNVAIADLSGGLSLSNISEGLECFINFTHNNPYSPVITGIVNNFYQDRDNSDQGAFIPDNEVYNVGTKDHIIALNLDWINEKEINTYPNYQNIDSDIIAMDLVSSINKYDNGEIGITHLNNKSTVKVKNNGDIDIFSANNTGIRVSSDGVIKLYAKDVLFTNSETEETDESISSQLTIAQIMKIALAYDIIKETDQYVSSIKTSIQGLESINGDQS